MVKTNGFSNGLLVIVNNAYTSAADTPRKDNAFGTRTVQRALRMGAGVVHGLRHSASELPERVDLSTCQELLGAKFDQVAYQCT